jgi:uncharacterized protein
MNKLIFIIGFCLYIASHFFLYIIWQYFLNINYSLLIISSFFLLSIFLIIFRYFIDNIFLRFIYLIASFWAALVLNTFLIFLFLFVLNLLFRINYSFNLYGISLILLFIIQYYSAYHLKIRKIKVRIKDLPQYWHNKKVVHISDLHLGPIWRKNFLRRLINKIQQLKPSAVFITGDMFDGMDSNYSWFSSELNNLKVSKGIYYSFGNHDEYLGAKRVISLFKKTNVYVLNNKMMEIEGLQIIGLSCGHHLNINLKKELEKINYNQKKASILLFHEPRNIKAAKLSGIDLQLSGHTHAGQIFPFNLLTILNYPGRNFGLLKIGDYSLNVSSGVGTWGPPLRLFTNSEIVEIILEKK